MDIKIDYQIKIIKYHYWCSNARVLHNHTVVGIVSFFSSLEST